MLYDKLKDYSQSGIYPFHMPGHKRNISDDTIPYNIDLTEIEGFDNLHNPQGCIKELADKAARLYSVSYAYLLVNGATGGILSAIRALTNYGDKVIVARNCHKSVYNAIELCGLDAAYALPEIDERFGIFSSVKPQQIEKLLISNPDTRLVIITTPTYEGVVSDVKSIADICHSFGAKLFIDEAHGAHFPFGDKFPKEAVSLGADVAVTSLHKTLPSLTQTALLICNNSLIANRLEENLSVFETSSPSYILMSSIERCLDFIENNTQRFENYTLNLNKFKKEAEKLSNLKVLCSDDDREEHSFFDFDISKLIISTRGTSITGVKLAELLRNNYQLETEMSYTDYVIAMTSVCDTAEGFSRLNKALSEIDRNISKINVCNYFNNYADRLPKKVFKSSDKYSYTEIKTPITNAIGKISLEYVWAYPPGIPLLVPGEMIDEITVGQIKHLTSVGVGVFSSCKNIPDYINVADNGNNIN